MKRSFEAGRHCAVRNLTLLFAAALFSMAPLLRALGQERAARDVDAITAIVGATLIDGNGGPPLPDATLLVRDKRIVAVGKRADVRVPKGARLIEGKGKFLLPGFIDSNVHVTLYGSGVNDGTAAFARYQEKFVDIAIEGSQLLLKYGVTTARDSYGMLAPGLAARDAIERSETPGTRLLIAGNIVGWGGPWSITMTFNRATPDHQLSFLQRQISDAITQGVGEDLTQMEPEQLRRAINAYLDKGVDFVKYGATSHSPRWATMILFSERAQRALIEEVHRRGKMASVHAITLEGLRMSIEAGVDLIQHAEALDVVYSDSLLELVQQRKPICSLQANMYTGKVWERTVKNAAEPKVRANLKALPKVYGGYHLSHAYRKNAELLIQRGCLISVGTDALVGDPPEFNRPSEESEPSGEDTITLGPRTLESIEGLVELGMTPLQAITAATKNGAIACGALERYGTLEPGKYADMLLLDGDPVADIHNIRRQSLVMKEGQVIDTARLPLRPVFYRN